MRSKLFNPKLYQRRPGNVLDEREVPDCFVNPPTHAEVPLTDDTTFQGYGMSMSQKDQAYAKTPQRGKFVTKSGDSDYEY